MFPSTRERYLAASRERAAVRRRDQSPSTRERRRAVNRERAAARRRDQPPSAQARCRANRATKRRKHALPTPEDGSPANWTSQQGRRPVPYIGESTRLTAIVASATYPSTPPPPSPGPAFNDVLFSSCCAICTSSVGLHAFSSSTANQRLMYLSAASLSDV